MSRWAREKRRIEKDEAFWNGAPNEDETAPQEPTIVRVVVVEEKEQNRQHAVRMLQRAEYLLRDHYPEHAQVVIDLIVDLNSVEEETKVNG